MTSPSFTASRTLSAATAAYGVFALVKPDHLARFLQVPARASAGYRVLGYTYGGRDLAISTLALLGRSPDVVRSAMILRVAMDLTDCAALAITTSDAKVRSKVLAATLSWAALNTAALVIDTRRG